MPYQLYGRLCVGAPLKVEAAARLHDDFLASLDLPRDADAETVFSTLRLDTPKHKLHLPDRMRYENALEAFIDVRHSVDFALGGVSENGLFDPRRGFLFVGVRVEQFEMIVPEVPRKSADPTRPQWLHKGDVTAGSELVHALGPDARKAFEHVGRMYQRAAKSILADALARVKELPLAPQHAPDWALCRWLVDVEHFSTLDRHGRAR